MLKLNIVSTAPKIHPIYLNTSHVKVKHIAQIDTKVNNYNLNTSHVKVKLKASWENFLSGDLFKYISC